MSAACSRDYPAADESGAHCLPPLMCPACDGMALVELEQPGDRDTAQGRPATCHHCRGTGVRTCAFCDRPAVVEDGEPLCSGCAAAFDVDAFVADEDHDGPPAPSGVQLAASAYHRPGVVPVGWQ